MLSVAESMQSHHLGDITSSEGSRDAVTPEGGSYANSQEVSRHIVCWQIHTRDELWCSPV